MSKREGGVYRKLKERICRPEDRFDRIENGMAAGWPDVNYCFAGCEGWIELKAPEREPERDSTALFGSQHGVSLEQRNWFLAQTNARGRGYLFIATPASLILIPGEKASHHSINSLTVRQLISAAIWFSARPVNNPERWFRLRETLTT